MTTPTSPMVALFCKRDEHEFLIPVDAVHGVSETLCALPPPWAEPWIGGLAWIEQNLHLVVDPMGLLTVQTAQTPTRATLVAMRTPAYAPQYAVVVDAVYDMQKLVRAEPIDNTLPSGWHCPSNWFTRAIDRDGMLHALLDCNQVAAAVAAGYRNQRVA